MKLFLIISTSLIMTVNSLASLKQMTINTASSKNFNAPSPLFLAENQKTTKESSVQKKTTKPDLKVNKSMQATLRALESLKRIEADFKQVRRVKKWQTDITTLGHFTLSRHPQNYIIWEVTAPSYTAIKVTSDQISLKSDKPSSNWKALDNKQMKEQMSSIFSWLSFDLKKMSEGFQVTTKSKNQLHLSPLNHKSYFDKIKIEFGKNKYLKKIEMIEKSDDSLIIVFSNTKVQK